MEAETDGADGDSLDSVVAAATRLRITLRAAASSGMTIAELAQVTGLSEADVAGLLDRD